MNVIQAATLQFVHLAPLRVLKRPADRYLRRAALTLDPGNYPLNDLETALTLSGQFVEPAAFLEKATNLAPPGDDQRPGRGGGEENG